MITQANAKMFLASERGHTETNRFRSYNTFNFGGYRHAHKSPFGALYVLNDDTLAGNQEIQQTVEEDSDIVLIPVVGATRYKDSQGHESMVHAGEVQVQNLPRGATLSVANPFEQELVNFLQLWIKQPGRPAKTPANASFDLDSHRNQLLTLSASPVVRMGKFTGREECVYQRTQSAHGLFVFVLEGAFEVQYRLLEARDALALWNLEEIEIEALSNDAILLVMEIPML